MIFRGSIEHMQEIFLRQFERDGDQWLYRKHGRGAPIPVSDEERAEFVTAYRKASVRMLWLSVAAAFVAIVLGMLLAPELMDEGPGIIVLSLVLAPSILIVSNRTSTAPARALDGRTPVGKEITRDEVYTKRFATTSWIPLALITAISTAIFVECLVSSAFDTWPDYFWAAISFAVSVMGFRALWLKQRFAP